MHDDAAVESPHVGDGDAPLTRRELRRLREAQKRSVTRDDFAVADLFTGPTTDEAADSVPTILIVCTGNICRSPLAEVLLRARLADLSIRVHSAGTHALVGKGMPDLARALVPAFGGTESAAAEHRARMLSESLLEDADLVLTMTAEHNTHAVQLAPSRLHYTFPVRKFARLAATLSDEDLRQTIADASGPRSRLQAVVRSVSHQRGHVSPPKDDEDVIDPYRRSAEVYEASAGQIAPALVEVERVVRAALRRATEAPPHRAPSD